MQMFRCITRERERLKEIENLGEMVHESIEKSRDFLESRRAANELMRKVTINYDEGVDQLVSETRDVLIDLKMDPSKLEGNTLFFLGLWLESSVPMIKEAIGPFLGKSYCKRLTSLHNLSRLLSSLCLQFCRTDAYSLDKVKNQLESLLSWAVDLRDNPKVRFNTCPIENEHDNGHLLTEDSIIYTPMCNEEEYDEKLFLIRHLNLIHIKRRRVISNMIDLVVLKYRDKGIDSSWLVSLIEEYVPPLLEELGERKIISMEMQMIDKRRNIITIPGFEEQYYASLAVWNQVINSMSGVLAISYSKVLRYKPISKNYQELEMRLYNPQQSYEIIVPPIVREGPPIPAIVEENVLTYLGCDGLPRYQISLVSPVLNLCIDPDTSLSHARGRPVV